MPEKETLRRARADKRAGKAPSTQAGEFVREEIEHVREGKHGARSTKQAIAIGLQKARSAGVKLPPPPGESKAAPAKRSGKKVSAKRSRAAKKALKRAPHSTVSKKALSKQARTAAKKRSAKERSASAKKAARTRARRAT